MADQSWGLPWFIRSIWLAAPIKRDHLTLPEFRHTSLLGSKPASKRVSQTSLHAAMSQVLLCLGVNPTICGITPSLGSGSVLEMATDLELSPRHVYADVNPITREPLGLPCSQVWIGFQPKSCNKKKNVCVSQSYPRSLRMKSTVVTLQ